MILIRLVNVLLRMHAAEILKFNMRMDSYGSVTLICRDALFSLHFMNSFG